MIHSVPHIAFCFLRRLDSIPGHRLPLTRLHDHTQTNRTRQDFPRRVIRQTQRPLPDNTKHSRQTDIHAPVRLEPRIPASEGPMG